MNKIDKRIWLGLSSLLLFTLGLLFGVAFGNKSAYGDIILKFIGLNSWSNNNTGLHYTAIITLTFLTPAVVLGYMFFKETLELKTINGKRRINTLECKLSIVVVIISSFILPGKILQDGALIEYAFGLPFNYWGIYQKNKRSSQLFDNLFNGNVGMNVNIVNLFVDIVIIYYVLLLLKKICIKVRMML
jgi:hypothetical protein